jgi:hypothetical protein
VQPAAIQPGRNEASNKPQYPCDYPGCPKTFKFKYNMVDHRKNKHPDPVTGKLRWFCCAYPACSKKFQTKRSYDRHVRGHNQVATESRIEFRTDPGLESPVNMDLFGGHQHNNIIGDIATRLDGTGLTELMDFTTPDGSFGTDNSVNTQIPDYDVPDAAAHFVSSDRPGVIGSCHSSGFSPVFIDHANTNAIEATDSWHASPLNQFKGQGTSSGFFSDCINPAILAESDVVEDATYV